MIVHSLVWEGLSCGLVSVTGIASARQWGFALGSSQHATPGSVACVRDGCLRARIGRAGRGIAAGGNGRCMDSLVSGFKKLYLLRRTVR